MIYNNLTGEFEIVNGYVNDLRSTDIGVLTTYLPALYVFKVHSSNAEYNNIISCASKVGETFRGVNNRLKEWKKSLKKHANDKDLKLELIASYSLIKNPYLPISFNNPLISDIDVHATLIEKGYERLDKKQAGSNEFFKFPAATNEFIKEQVRQAKDKKFDEFIGKYTRTLSGNLAREDKSFNRNQDFDPRFYQRYVITQTLNKFNIYNEVLIEQSARTGKTFEACTIVYELSKKLNKNTATIVVTGKTDVKLEHREAWQSHTKFVDFVYGELQSNGEIKYWKEEDDNSLFETFDEFVKYCKYRNKNIVIYTSVQLLNENGNIKSKFNRLLDSVFDFGIFDECHFGLKSERQWERCIKEINCNKKLYLSATPYRIKLNEKIECDKIVKFDIQEYLKKDILYSHTDYNHLLEKNQKDELRGKFPTLFTVCPTNTTHYSQLIEAIAKTKNENLIKQLLEEIFYQFNESGLGCFTNRIIDNFLCRHILVKAETVELAKLYAKVAAEIIDEHNETDDIYVCLLTDHEIEQNKKIKNYADKSLEAYKKDINEIDKNGKRTISFTCDRFLTGVTVTQWDTFIILKNIRSAETYEQETKRIYSICPGKSNVIVWDFNLEAMTSVAAFNNGYIDTPSTDKLKNIESAEETNKLSNTVSNLFNIVQLKNNKYVKVTPTDVVKMISNGTIHTGWTNCEKDYLSISSEIDKIFAEDFGIVKANKHKDASQSRYRAENNNDDEQSDTNNNVQSVDMINMHIDDGVEQNKEEKNIVNTIKNTEKNRDVFVYSICEANMLENQITDIYTLFNYTKLHSNEPYLNIANEICEKIITMSNEIRNINLFIAETISRYNTLEKCIEKNEMFINKYEQKQ